jgi:hypothetical protein
VSDVSDAVREDVPAPTPSGDGATCAEEPPPRARDAMVARIGGLRTALPAGLAALVAVVCAALLPFAPVSVNEPVVTWPRDPGRPQSTLLSLTAFRPLAMDIRFSCETVRRAQAAGGVVVATADPQSPAAGIIGIIARVRDGVLQVEASERLLVEEPVPTGSCEYRISGQSRGVPSYVRGEVDPNGRPAADLSAFAQPDNAQLAITRDGVLLMRTNAEQLPDVDLLATDATSVPEGGLSVRLRVDDEFTSSPTPVKEALTALLLAALLATAVLLWLQDRATPRVPTIFRWAWPRAVDVVVPAALVFWLFVAPATDDDGYYAAMARNSTLSGEVGNYYQLYDQNFTPFTWFYQALGWWQMLVGNAPVLQRIPAAVFGIVTWFALRRIVGYAMAEWAPDRRAVRAVAHAVLAVVFLAWWLPQDMGVRPETVVAMFSSLTLLTVLVAARRSRLALAWLACALAGFGFAAHPTGFTLFAPLLAGLPLLWKVVRPPDRPQHRVGTALRAFAVASGGMVAPLLAFADGALRDFYRGQTIFLSLQGQDDWTTEINRYNFLLTEGPMGNYAKRAAILVCLVALVWFAVLAVAARARRVPLPTPLWLTGSATAIAFAALWLTPSKWTHHFGALAGVGPVFLALLLVMAVRLTRDVVQSARLPIGVLIAAAVSFVVAIALGWSGPNIWPYASLTGMRRPELAPAVKDVPLGSITVWALVVVVIGAVLVAVARRTRRTDARLAALAAVPTVVVVSLLGTSIYLVESFADAAVRRAPPESVWAQGLADPSGSRCGAAGALRVLDPATASVLPLAPGLPAPEPPVGFLPGGGFYEGDPPQGPAAAQVWGSLYIRDERGPERNDGQMSTGWYALPRTLADGAAITVLAAGTLENGNSLTAVYGRRDGTGVTAFDEDDQQQELTDNAHDTTWRTFTLTPPPGADVVQLQAVDGNGAIHGWLAFSAPAVQRAVPLARYLPADAPVAVAWQFAFAYPCQRQPAVVDGITEPVRYAVLWANDPEQKLAGMRDNTWVAGRGGLFAQVPRSQSVQQLAMAPGTDPHIQVYRFVSDLARSAYTVTRDRRTVWGASIDTGPGDAPLGS